MVHCPYPECGWQSIAPSAAAAQSQFADHLVDRHAETVDADIPEGMVQVRTGEDEEWRTMTPEQASAYHDAVHGTDD